jgi:hypothetical protein
MMGS